MATSEHLSASLSKRRLIFCLQEPANSSVESSRNCLDGYPVRGSPQLISAYSWVKPAVLAAGTEWSFIVGMEGEDLVCNFKKCRKRLSSYAYVTACSHIFCDEDGTREFNKSQTCPACQTNLSAKFEIVRNDLQPSEQYKSMALAGLKPEVIMEVCSRALSFWVFQSYQEKTYQQYMATKAKDRASQLEQYYEQVVSRTATELSNVKSQLESVRKDLDSTKKKYNEASDKLSEKNRQHQKLQAMYDSLRRKCITMSSFEGAGDGPIGRPMTPLHTKIQNMAGGDMIHKTRDRNTFSSASEFDFQPVDAVSEPPANSVQRRFSNSLGTPRK